MPKFRPSLRFDSHYWEQHLDPFTLQSERYDIDAIMDTSGLSTDAEANHDASIQATAAIFCFLSILATSLRVYSRKTKGVPLAVDDYLIFLSLTLAISESVMYAYGAKHYGLGRHLLGLDKQQLVDYAKVYYVSVSRLCIF